MYAPYRIAAPPPSEGFEAIDAYETVLRARAGRLRAATLLLSCSVVALWLGVAATPRRPSPDVTAHDAAVRTQERVARARATLASVNEAARAEQARFTAAVLAAIDAELAGGRMPCATTVTVPEHAPGLVARKRALPLLVVAAGDRDLPSPSLAPVLARVRRAEEQLARGNVMGALAATGATRSLAEPKYDVVVVASTLKHPSRTSESTFAPGEITGRAYLYDFAQHRVTCASDVHVVSSSAIAYSFVPGLEAPAALDQGPSLASSLDRDLDDQLERAIVDGLLARATPAMRGSVE